ncbi:Protein of unknown function [Lactobacillus helveticus CIRM-BIA 101]|nr:Protein of unknown function [Lactobacillus helveticus CIRM-BIA 101]
MQRLLLLDLDNKEKYSIV